MNGIVYPEITDVSKATSGGYLSASAGSQLNTFKNKMNRAKYLVQGFTIAISGNSGSATATSPSGYIPVGAVGIKYANNGGALTIICRGYRYASSKVYAYYTTGTYGSIEGNATVYVLYRRGT